MQHPQLVVVPGGWIEDLQQIQKITAEISSRPIRRFRHDNRNMPAFASASAASTNSQHPARLSLSTRSTGSPFLVDTPDPTRQQYSPHTPPNPTLLRPDSLHLLPVVKEAPEHDDAALVQCHTVAAARAGATTALLGQLVPLPRAQVQAPELLVGGIWGGWDSVWGCLGRFNCRV